MSKNGSEIQKYLQSSGLRAVLFLTVPIIVILIIIMFVVILQPGRIEEPRLVIDNIEEVLPDVPSETVHLIEEKLSLYNQLAEIDGAVPYVLKYVLEAEDSRKGALAVAIANKLLDKNIVVDDSELPQDFWCFFEEGTPKYYAARRVAAENR